MKHTNVLFFALMSLSVSLFGMGKFSSPSKSRKPISKLPAAHSYHNNRDEKHRAEANEQVPDLELGARHSAHSNLAHSNYGSPGSTSKLTTVHETVSNEAECNKLLVEKIREAMNSKCCQDPLAQRLAEFQIEDQNLYNLLLRHFKLVPETPVAKADKAPSTQESSASIESTTTTNPTNSSAHVATSAEGTLQTVMRQLVQQATERDALIHQKQAYESEKLLKEHKESTEKLFAEHKETAERAAQQHKRTTKKERLISATVAVVIAVATYLTTHYSG